MIVVLLLVVIAILLFGAGVVKGWMKRGLMIAIGGITILFLIGLAASKYQMHKRDTQRKSDAIVATAETLRMVATQIGRPESVLVDRQVYVTATDFMVCGSIAGTTGFGGIDGRQRFLTNGGGRFEFEKPGKVTDFNERKRLFCNFDENASMH